MNFWILDMPISLLYPSSVAGFLLFHKVYTMGVKVFGIPLSNLLHTYRSFHQAIPLFLWWYKLRI